MYPDVCRQAEVDLTAWDVRDTLARLGAQCGFRQGVREIRAIGPAVQDYDWGVWGTHLQTLSTLTRNLTITAATMWILSFPFERIHVQEFVLRPFEYDVRTLSFLQTALHAKRLIVNAWLLMPDANSRRQLNEDFVTELREASDSDVYLVIPPHHEEYVNQLNDPLIDGYIADETLRMYPI